jgi:glucose/arabinose dehydrogenase
VASGLVRPVYVTAPPGDTRRLFVVEQPGRILILRKGALLSQLFLDIAPLVSGANEQGLLSLAFDPNYAANRFLYIAYTDHANSLVVARYQTSAANPERVEPGSRHVLLTLAHPYSNHNGGQLQFGLDGLLYVGIGDGGSEGDPNNYGQNRHVLLAKILTLDVRAAHPKPKTYAYGLRNPWRFSFDSTTGALWIGDVGQNSWEEIDYLKAGTPPGTNFGWSYYEGDHLYKTQPIDRSRLVFPLYEYSHAFGCAVVGGYVYRGSAIPALRGWYLFGDYCTGRMWMKPGPRGAVRIARMSGRVTSISSFGQDASGELYVVSLSGRVYKIVR